MGLPATVWWAESRSPTREFRQILLVAGVSALVIAIVLVAGQVGTTEARIADDALNAGVVAHKAGDLTKARTQYGECLKHDATNKVCRYNVGLIAQGQHDLETAENEYRLSLSADPNYTPALFNLATVGTTNGDMVGAVLLYRKFVQLLPNDPRGHLSLGVLLRSMGDTVNGQREIAIAVRLDPTITVPLESQAPSAAPSSASRSVPGASP